MHINKRSIKSCYVKALVLGLSLYSLASQAGLEANWTYTGDAPDQPGDRAWFNMTYDSNRNQAAMFGGSCSFTDGRTRCNDVWGFDAVVNSWTERQALKGCLDITHTPPSPRDSIGFVYEPVNDLYWLFGGLGTRCNTKTILGNAAAGTDMSTLVFPSSAVPVQSANYYKDWTVKVGSKQAYVSAYDPATNVITLATPVETLAVGAKFFLFPQRGGGTYYFDPATQTWTGFDGPHWNNNDAKPSNRLTAAFQYSTADRAILMYGGKSNTNDTWLLDVDTKSWVQMIPQDKDNTVLGLTPPSRLFVAGGLAYDQGNDVFVLFGGRCAEQKSCVNKTSMNDTWIYSIKENTWTNAAPANAPAARYEHQMTYDPVHGVVVLFGGWDDLGNYMDDTWVYDVATNVWTDISPAVSPTPRMRGALTYDSNHQVTVLYGGRDDRRMRDVWVLQLFDDGGGPVNQDPVANFSISPTTGDYQTLFTFDGTASYDPDGISVSCEWDFDDGDSDTGCTANHTYAAAGTYNVVLTVTDNRGAEDTATIVLRVTDVVVPPQLVVEQMTLRGTVDDPSITEVMINGSVVSVVNGEFEYSYSASPSPQDVVITAVNPQGGSATVTVTTSVQ